MDKNQVRKVKEKLNISLSLCSIGIISVIISLFFIPLMKNETRRYGEDVIIYDYFAMTLFYLFLIIGILLLVCGLIFFTINIIKRKQLYKNGNKN